LGDLYLTGSKFLDKDISTGLSWIDKAIEKRGKK
jgi:hypothetical protein